MKKISNINHILLALAINLCFILLFSIPQNQDNKSFINPVKISLISYQAPTIQSPSVEKAKNIKTSTTQQISNKLSQAKDHDNLYIPPQFNYGSADNPIPKYPKLAIRQKHQGQVIICADIGIEGGVSNASICNSSGSNLLDNAALKTIKNWRFTAARQGNEFVVATIQVPITFSLSKS